MNVSCFCIFNEIDLLRLRLEYEFPFFDKFVIVEATKTHAGREKLLYFEKYRTLFEKFSKKIVYVVVDDMPPVEKIRNVGWRDLVAHEYRWHLEEHQRNCFLRGLKQLDLDDMDWVLVTDLDEFVNPAVFLKATQNRHRDTLHYFMLNDYRYTVRNPPVSSTWLGAFAARWRAMIHGNPTLLRWSHAELLDRMHWNTPFTNLKVLRRRSLRLLSSSRPNSKAVDTPTKHAIRKQLGGKTIKEAVADSGLTRGRLHRNAGCHLSMMNGGYGAWLKLKLQNFAHAECQGDDTLEDTAIDHYAKLRNFIDLGIAENQYDWSDLDPDLPDFFRRRIRDFPILLNPLATNNIAK